MIFCLQLWVGVSWWLDNPLCFWWYHITIHHCTTIIHIPHPISRWYVACAHMATLGISKRLEKSCTTLTHPTPHSNLNNGCSLTHVRVDIPKNQQTNPVSEKYLRPYSNNIFKLSTLEDTAFNYENKLWLGTFILCSKILSEFS